MNDMLNSLEGFDSGSNYRFGQKMAKSSNPRSLFDLSHLNTLTMNNAGLLYPIALWETIPSDDFDINVDCLLRVMPQVVPLYSRQRLYVYAFWSRYSDLWNNWQVFMDKGYTGNVSKSIPTLKYGVNYTDNLPVAGVKIMPDTLADYMGLPIGASASAMFDIDGYADAGDAKISALPFMMYLRIYRDYFMNKNEWINDRVMLPDDDSRFRLDDNGELLSAKDNGDNFAFAPNMFYNSGNPIPFTDIMYTEPFEPGGAASYSMGLLYHDYPDDYFTSALPFTQRGTTPTLTKNIDPTRLSLDFTDSMYNFSDAGSPTGLNRVGFYLNGDSSSDKNNNTLFGRIDAEAYGTSENTTIIKNALNKGKIRGDSVGITFTLEEIRKLAIEQIELERLARTDGSYRQFGLSFFGEASKASYDFRPLYIGGTYKNLAFTEVLQTAGSTVPTTAESGNSPLGSYAGHGISGITSGRIGHIHCDDYGMIMLIACIMPDVYYSQGLDRIFTDSIQEEKWLPERVKLGMQPIYNKELYYAGNNGSSQGDDNYLWAYQNPFDYLRYMPNKIHGKIADMNNKTFRPYTQSRHFTQLPNWGRSFSEAKDVRKDYLFAPSEDAYSAQFNINIRAVRPLPYKAIPAQIIN